MEKSGVQTTSENVFEEITSDVPKEVQEATIQLFKNHEDLFAEYLDDKCYNEDFYGIQ
jgi:hypothetical protein